MDPRPNVIKLSLLQIAYVDSKLECLFLAGYSSLVQCLWVKQSALLGNI
jgi:hypothetical protein